MREIEFLPDWYATVRRRKAMVVVQSWATVAIVSVAGLWMLAKQGAVKADQARLADILVGMDHTRADLRKLDDLLALQQQWRQKDQVLVKLGLHVEATRLLNRIEEAMPHEMAMLDFDLATDEVKPLASPLAKAAGQPAPDVPPDRRLKARLKGVAPTDVDLAVFLKQLSDVPYFENLAMTYAKDRTDSGHVMREFEVTFSLNLNAPAVN